MTIETEKTEERCRFSKPNVKYPSPGYCIPAPRQCEECEKFKPINLKKVPV